MGGEDLKYGPTKENARKLNSTTKAAVDAAVTPVTNGAKLLSKLTSLQPVADTYAAQQPSSIPNVGLGGFVNQAKAEAGGWDNLVLGSLPGIGDVYNWADSKINPESEYGYGLNPAPYNSPFEPDPYQSGRPGPSSRNDGSTSGSSALDDYNARIAAMASGGGLSPEEEARFRRTTEDLALDMSRAEQDNAIALGDLNRQREDLLATYGIKSPFLDQAVKRQEASWALTQQELALRKDKANRDLAYAEEQSALTVANRAAIGDAYVDYRAMVGPLFQKSIDEAGLLYEKSAPGSIDIQSREVERLAALQRQGVGIANDETYGELSGAARQALLDEANFGLDYRIDNASNRGESDKRILAATEQVAVTGAKLADAMDAAAIARRAGETDAAFSVRQEAAMTEVMNAIASQKMVETDAQQAALSNEANMDSLSQNRQLLDQNLSSSLGNLDSTFQKQSIATQRLLQDLMTAQSRNGEDQSTAQAKALADLMGMDADGYGRSAAGFALQDGLEGTDPARQAFVSDTLQEMFGDGITTLARAEALIAGMEAGWTDDQGVKHPPEISNAEGRALREAITAYQDGAAEWSSGSIQDGINNSMAPSTMVADRVDGGGATGQPKGAEALNNYENRNNPLYVQRANFAAQNAPQVAAMFGLRPDGINYYRPPDAHVGNSDRSPNSDHQSAGAVDFHGSMDSMQDAATFMRNQPYVSFAKVHGTPPHLHVSYMLGY